MNAVLTPRSAVVIHGPVAPGTGFAVTSVTMTNDGKQSAPMDEVVGLVPFAKGTCEKNHAVDGPVYATVPFEETVHLAYREPLLVGGASTVHCLVARVASGASAGWDAHVNVIGYLFD